MFCSRSNFGLRLGAIELILATVGWGARQWHLTFPKFNLTTPVSQRLHGYSFDDLKISGASLCRSHWMQHVPLVSYNWSATRSAHVPSGGCKRTNRKQTSYTTGVNTFISSFCLRIGELAIYYGALCIYPCHLLPDPPPPRLHRVNFAQLALQHSHGRHDARAGANIDGHLNR